MTCRRSAELISASLDADLPFPRRFGLGFHVMLCGACRTYRRQLDTLETAVRSILGDAGPRPGGLPDSARAEIQAAVLDELEG